MPTSDRPATHKAEPEVAANSGSRWIWANARPQWSHLIVGLMCLLLGFALSAQIRSQDADPIGRMNQADLVSLLGDLEQRERDLTVASAELRVQIAELEDAANSAQAAQEAAERAYLDAMIVAGAIPVEGPGVTMRVVQGRDPIPSSVFVTTMAELRNGGAEAIELNGVRLSGRTWFANSDAGIIVDGQPLSSPFLWTAIGDSQTLSVALDIRGGASAQFRAYGATVDVETKEQVTIRSATSPIEPRWAEVSDGS